MENGSGQEVYHKQAFWVVNADFLSINSFF